jgi:hypothetical protein
MSKNPQKTAIDGLLEVARQEIDDATKHHERHHHDSFAVGMLINAAKRHQAALELLAGSTSLVEILKRFR